MDWQEVAVQYVKRKEDLPWIQQHFVKWMVAVPKIIRMFRKFEVTAATVPNKSSQRQNHHEDNKRFQSRYIRHMSQMAKSIRVDRNPFAEQ